MRVARTLADLEGKEELGIEEVIRATSFRTLDQGLP
jgi:predicted ATPase with chaperone activity